MEKTKKDFQKVIGAIRKEAGTGSFPKPMMTAAQMMKNEATVNCGGEWSTAEKTLERANKVMQDSRFVAFLEAHNAKAGLELNNFKTYQIRIHFN